MTHRSARSLLLTLFGEYVRTDPEPVWTSTLLVVLEGVEVAEKSARQALARAEAAGWIEGIRDGRRTAWRLAARGRQLIAEGSSRVRALGREPNGTSNDTKSGAWDGRWLVLQVTLSESQRADRLRLYRSLSWIGFGNPTPGLWICPYVDREPDVRAVIERFDLAGSAYAFRAEALAIGVSDRELVARAWNLEQVSAHYAELLAEFDGMRPRTPSATLISHVALVNALQRLPAIDPGLPDALLPKAWIGRHAAAKLLALRVKWADVAHAEWRRLARG